VNSNSQVLSTVIDYT